MTAAEWKKRITDACEAVGTYKPAFEAVIDTLSDILERRDDARKAFEDSGRELIVEHTNAKGATNLEQNPVIRMINDLNRDALAYWRDLGLTPAGLKKIDERALKEQKKTSLSDLLKGIGNE